MTKQLTVGEATLIVSDQMSSTRTGSHHYLKSDAEGVDWRVRGTVLHYELHNARKPINRASVCRCRRCKQLKLRKGGSNTNHYFVCKDCRKIQAATRQKV